MRLIVNADDFGYTKAINYGIIEAFKNGIITSTTAMVNMPEFDHAVELAKKTPNLGIGIHLVLTAGFPLSKNVPSLINEKGVFKKENNVNLNLVEDEIEQELQKQIEKFISSGLVPTHLDSHHNMHSSKLILPLVLKLARKYHLPLRRANNEPWTDSKYGCVKKTDSIFRNFYGEDNINNKTIESFLEETSNSNKTIEMNCHPGYIDSELLNKSSYVKMRVKELSLLTSEKIKRKVKEENVKLITYKDL